MRGCKLKNTLHAIGVVVYTGNETKMMKNLTKGAHKMSSVESKLNNLIIILFLFQTLCCIVQSIGSSIFMRNSSTIWYLKPDEPSVTFDLDNIGYSSFLTYFTHLILYSQMIPISLYVTAEVVKSFQAALIEVRCPKVFLLHKVARVTPFLRLIGQYIFPQPTRQPSAERLT